MVGTILGALCGWFLPGVMLSIDFIGALFLNALKIIVFPLVATTLILGITTLGDYTKLGRTTLKTLGFIAATSGIAAAIGLILALVLGPGRGITSGSSPLPIEVMPPQLRSFGDFLTSLIPSNLIEAVDGGNYIGLVVVSIVTGIVLTTRQVRGRTVLSVVKDLQDILMRLLSWLLAVAPLGIAVLVGAAVAANRASLSEFMSGAAMLILVVVIGLLVQGVLLLPTILRLYGQRSPVEYLGNMLPAFWTAFGTASSSATFPVTYEAVVERNRVDERAGSYVLPLSMTLNMNGSALYIAAAAVFVAQAASISLSVVQILQLFLGSLIVSLALGGVPNASLWGVVAVASIAGFPREAMAAFSILLVVDWVLDRLRTVVNVAGDGVAAAVIAETFEFKTVGQRGARMAGARTRPVRRDDRSDRGSADSRPDRRPGRDRDRRPVGERGRRPDRPPSDSTRRDAPDTDRREPERAVSPPDREDRRMRTRPDRSGDESGRDRRRSRPETGDRRSDRGPRDDSRRGQSGGGDRERSDRPRGGDSRHGYSRGDRRPSAGERSQQTEEVAAPDSPVETAPVASFVTPTPVAPTPVAPIPTIEPAAETSTESSSPSESPRVFRRVLKPTSQATAAERPDDSSDDSGQKTTEDRAAEEYSPAVTPEVPTSLPDVVAERDTDVRSDDGAESEAAERPLSFGRKVSRKGRQSSSPKAPDQEVGPVGGSNEGEPTEPVEAEDSYSSENIAFGRSKRKKTR